MTATKPQRGDRRLAEADALQQGAEVIEASSLISMKKNLERREEADRRLPVEPQTKIRGRLRKG